MPLPVPVTPCVDSGIAYDNFAKGIVRIHDMFFVCFYANHRKILLSLKFFAKTDIGSFPDNKYP